MTGKQLEKEEGLSLVDVHINDLSEDDKDNLEKIAYESWGKYKKYGNKNNAKKEWDSLKRHFINEYGFAVYESPKGLKFYPKNRLNPDAEKARHLVGKHILRTIKDIENEIPSLADHLKKHIKKGWKCIYISNPDNPIEWDIRW